jgi:hypothetical protein
VNVQTYLDSHAGTIISIASGKNFCVVQIHKWQLGAAGIGIANPVNLQNYGFMMTKTIGQPLHACGMFCIAAAEIEELERRYHGLADAINGARGSLPGSYCVP